MIREMTDPSSIGQIFEQQPPSAILITDEALTAIRNANIWELVLSYVRSGGTAVASHVFAQLLTLRCYWSQFWRFPQNTTHSEYDLFGTVAAAFCVANSQALFPHGPRNPQCG
jgi:hypothetical protein